MARRGKPESVPLLAIGHIFVVELVPEKSGLLAKSLTGLYFQRKRYAHAE
jgi:hypothetical protein